MFGRVMSASFFPPHYFRLEHFERAGGTQGNIG